MKLYHSNKDAISSLQLSIWIASPIFFVLSVLSRFSVFLRTIFLIVMFLSIYLGFLYSKLSKKIFIEISKDKIVIARKIALSKEMIEFELIAQIFHKKNYLAVLKKDNKTVLINLFFLTKDDIKKLLMYLRFNKELQGKVSSL